jgi:hypothetical protein
MLCIYLNEKTSACNFKPSEDGTNDEARLPRVCPLINDECVFRPKGPFGPYDAAVR